MTLTEEKIDEVGASEKIFFKEASRTQEAEVLLVSLEDYIVRRFDPKPDGFLSKGEHRNLSVQGSILSQSKLALTLATIRLKLGNSLCRSIPTETRRATREGRSARILIASSRLPLDCECVRRN